MLFGSSTASHMTYNHYDATLHMESFHNRSFFGSLCTDVLVDLDHYGGAPSVGIPEAALHHDGHDGEEHDVMEHRFTQ